jgi:succinate dehydrogenase/fumarate reductase flavoprotein subunit
VIAVGDARRKFSCNDMRHAWDEEADVVVLGCGGAGAVAAITAYDTGAKVIVVEKGEFGGNTCLATMAFLCPTNNPLAREHIKALSFGRLGDDVIDAYVEWTSKNVEYIEQLGGEVETCFPGASFSLLPGSETMLRYRVRARADGELGGESLWNLLSKNLQQRNIPVHRHTIATRIIRSDDEVVGIATQKKERRFNIRARKAVVLATGGFEYNEELKREFLPAYPIFAYGNAGNTGDGIRLAQELGADLWHMNAVAAPMGYKFPEFQSAFIMRMPAYGYIIVDQNGNRFCNETGLEHYSMWMSVTSFDTESLRFARIPSYLIFDERTRLTGPITRVGHGANRAYRWSADNSEEVRREWIQSGNSPSQLASKLGSKAEQLTDTLESYQNACRIGTDEKFGRSKETLVGFDGKHYGVPLWPCLLNTQGGPKRNARGEIIDVRGKPIKRLYGVGEMGSIWGFLYQSGGNLAECLGLGRMVGLNAAAELPLN